MAVHLHLSWLAGDAFWALAQQSSARGGAPAQQLNCMASRGPDVAATDGARAGMPQKLVDKAGDLLEAGVDALRRADRAGVPVAYGSDLLGLMHGAQTQGIALHLRAQPPAAVLAALTVSPARLFRLDGEVGIVSSGARADLLLVKGARRLLLLLLAVLPRLLRRLLLLRRLRPPRLLRRLLPRVLLLLCCQGCCKGCCCCVGVGCAAKAAAKAAA
jgi:imidazolonepropionase-like amidohydrolase